MTDHIITAGDSPEFKDWVRRTGKEGEHIGIEFLIDTSFEQLINNDKAVKLLAEAIAGGADWQESILDRGVTDPTTLTPSEGDRYVVAAGATDVWATHDDDIAEYDGAAWVFVTPNKGFACYVEDELVQIVWNGAAWVVMGGGALANVVEDLTPQLGGMLDVNAFSLGDGTLELLSFSEAVSAVNELTVANAATGNGPSLTATGDDTNVDLTLDGKGTGVVKTLSSNLDVTGEIIVSGNVDGVDLGTLGSDFSTHDGGTAKAQHSAIGDHTHASAGAEGGQVDHGDTTGRGDDDHTQYTLAAGTRAFTGAQTVFTGIRHVIPWFIAGAIGAAVDQFAFVVPDTFASYTFVGARIYALTAPTDASLIVDVHKNGTTFYTTQGNRPTILTTANDSGDRIAPDVTAIAKGDIITVDVDQVGSTVAGSNLAISLVFKQTIV